MSYSVGDLTFEKKDTQTGTANAQLQFTFTTTNKRGGSLIFESVGGVFAAQNATIAVSNDNSTFIDIDTVGLGTGTSKLGKQYSDSNRATTVPVNPFDFTYIRVTVPALGIGISAKVTISAK